MEKGWDEGVEGVDSSDSAEIFDRQLKLDKRRNVTCAP
jgi:hypothetical protein